MRGLAAYQRGEYSQSERLLQDSLAVMRALKSTTDIIALLTDLGAVERSQEHYDEAAQYLSEALQLVEKSTSKETTAGVYGMMGDLALNCERWGEVREWMGKALLLAREIGWQEMIAYTQGGLAMAYETEERFDLALPLAQEALAVDLKLHSRNLPRTRKLVERLKEKMEAQESTG